MRIRLFGPAFPKTRLAPRCTFKSRATRQGRPRRFKQPCLNSRASLISALVTIIARRLGARRWIGEYFIDNPPSQFLRD